MTQKQQMTARQVVLRNRIDELCEEIDSRMDHRCKLLNEYNQLTLDVYFLSEERNKFAKELFGR